MLYRIYRGDAAGGPIDYQTPVATVAAPGWTSEPLAPGSVHRFAVRPFDPDTGLENENLDAAVRVALDAAGADAGPALRAPAALCARAGASGQIAALWWYPLPVGEGPAPARFVVWCNPGTTLPSEGQPPTATVPFVAGLAFYAIGLPGPTDATPYTLAVCAESPQGGRGPLAVTRVNGLTGTPDSPHDVSGSSI